MVDPLVLTPEAPGSPPPPASVFIHLLLSDVTGPRALVPGPSALGFKLKNP